MFTVLIIIRGFAVKAVLVFPMLTGEQCHMLRKHTQLK